MLLNTLSQLDLTGSFLESKVIIHELDFRVADLANARTRLSGHQVGTKRREREREGER